VYRYHAAEARVVDGEGHSTFESPQLQILILRGFFGEPSSDEWRQIRSEKSS